MKVRIKEAARARGYSLYALAQALGVAQQSVYSWASGRTQPSYESLDLLCMFLQCKISDILEPEPLTKERLEARNVWNGPKYKGPFWLTDSALTKGTRNNEDDQTGN